MSMSSSSSASVPSISNTIDAMTPRRCSGKEQTRGRKPIANHNLIATAAPTFVRDVACDDRLAVKLFLPRRRSHHSHHSQR
jgi:hypothetical protein